MCLAVNESRVKSSYYYYHTTRLSSLIFAVFNLLTSSVDKISPTFFVFMLLAVCVFAILVRNYHTTLSGHEFAGFNVLTDSVDKSSRVFFVFMLLFVCVFIIVVRNSIAIRYIKIK